MCPQAKEHQGLLATQETKKKSATESSLRPQREHGPVSTLMSDFQSPELLGTKFLLCKATQFVALCDGIPRKLTQSVKHLVSISLLSFPTIPPVVFPIVKADSSCRP